MKHLGTLMTKRKPPHGGFFDKTWKISPGFFHVDWAAELQGKLIGMATKTRGLNMFQHVNMLTSATKNAVVCG